MWVMDNLTGTLLQGCFRAHGTRSRQVSPPQTSCFSTMMSIGSWGAHSGSRLMVTRVGGCLGVTGEETEGTKTLPNTAGLIHFQEFSHNPPSGLPQAPLSARGAL